jgi:drug/metabolite transporter (DMT)-like permease
MGALSVGALAAIAIVVGYALKRKHVWPKAVPWLWLLGGFGIAGVAGDLLVKIGGLLTDLSSAGSAALFGAAVPAMVAIFLGTQLVIDMRPNASPTKWTPWVALAFPAILATAGGVFTQLHDTADDNAVEALAAVGTFFETAVSGI